MAVLYVDDDGSNTAPYETWAKAANALETVDGLAAAGEYIYIASDHVEQKNGASFVFDFANGTVPNPVVVISADQSSGEPPTTFETMHSQGGKFETQGVADDITLGGDALVYGVKLICKDRMTLGTNNKLTHFHECYLNSTDVVTLSGVESSIVFQDCIFELIGGTQAIVAGGDKTVWMRGCSFIDVGSSIIQTMTAGLRLTIEDSDLSVEPTIVVSMAVNNVQVILRRCELHADNFATEAPTGFDDPNSWFLAESCIAGTSLAPIIGMQYYADMYGVIEAETTLIRTGGASDGTTSYSWKMVSSADTIERHTCLRSPPIVAWLENDETTVKIYIYHDAVGSGGAGDLTDIECWVEVSSPNETANPGTTSQGAFQTSLPAVLAAAGDIPNDGVSAWGGALATKQVITVTVGPAEDGPVVLRVCLGKASTTMYVDPKLDIS